MDWILSHIGYFRQHLMRIFMHNLHIEQYTRPGYTSGMTPLRKPGGSAAWIAFPLILAAAVGGGVFLWKPLTEIFRDPQRARAWVESLGSAAPLAYLGLQFLQVVVFIIPGEVIQIGGGYVFGFWGATILSSLGILAGSVFNYYVGRLAGRPFVERLVKPEVLSRLEIASSGREAAGFFLLYVIPSIPKDALSYVVGMSRVSLPLFIAISGIGRLPGILGSAYIGNSAYQGEYGAALAVLAAAACLFFAGLVFKDKLTSAVQRALNRRGPKGGGSKSGTGRTGD